MAILMLSLMLAVLIEPTAAFSADSQDEIRSRFGRGVCDERIRPGSFLEGGNSATVAVKQQLVAKGPTREEARRYLDTLIQTGSESNRLSQCDAASRLWLVHMMPSGPVPKLGSAAQSTDTVVDWRNVGEFQIVTKARAIAGWEVEFASRRGLASSRNQLPQDSEVWWITGKDINGRAEFDFSLGGHPSPSRLGESAYVEIAWDRKYSPKLEVGEINDGIEERTWACHRVVAAIAIATEGLVGMQIRLGARAEGCLLKVELYRGQKPPIDLTPFVEKALAKASPEEVRKIRPSQSIERELARSIDRLVFTLLDQVIPKPGVRN